MSHFVKAWREQIYQKKNCFAGTETRKKALDYVNDMETFSQTCQSDDDTIVRRKGKEMQIIAGTLRSSLEDRGYDQGRMSYKDKFETLNFKLGVVRRLQQDKEGTLGEHRGYKRIIVNFMTLFFSSRYSKSY